MKCLSIIIPNYNYGQFIAAAVESALSVRWQDIEVIVVDDGSTDNSLAVLEGFRGRITVLEQTNSGPRAACNRGFEIARGDAIMFLDSDDVVYPDIALEVSRQWSEGASKYQVQMMRIDRNGEFLGSIFPRFPSGLSSTKIRRWMQATGAYPTPPGSGNVYPREFLEHLFPLGDECGDATDSACLAAAPYLGHVISIRRVLVGYREHGENRSNLLASTERFSRQIERAVQRQHFALRVGEQAANPTAVEILRRGRHLLQMRAAEYKLRPGTPVRPLPGDCARWLWKDALTCIYRPGPETPGERVLVQLWTLAVLVAPRRVAVKLITWRFRR